MDKKTGIIIGVLVAIVVALMIGAFVGDSKDNSILTINDIGYQKDDFENYYKVRYFEELTKSNDEAEDDTGEAEAKENDVDKEALKTTALREYATYMILTNEAKEKGYVMSSDTVKEIEDKYDAEDFDRETLTKMGVSKEDYVKARKLVEGCNGFTKDVGNYYEVPQSTIDNYFETNKDSLKGIDFRIMQFNITSTEESTNEAGETVPASTNKDEIVAKAQTVLDRVKAGEDFETLAKENADTRMVLTTSELKQVNGELESCDFPYLQSYLMFSCPDIETPLKALTNPGDYTELVTSDSYVAFARLEAVRDDVEETTREAMVTSIKQSVGESYLASLVQSAKIIINSRLLKNIEI